MIMLFSGFLSAQAQTVRPPAVAGMFYPENPDKLKSMVTRFLEQAEEAITGDIGGLVAPHAGYIYSGPVAGWAYRQIQGRHYDYVIVISPSHFDYFNGISVYSGDAYQTPLGIIPIEKQLATKLAQHHPDIQLSTAGHYVQPGSRNEHALEVHLPFLQVALGQFKLIPVVMGDQNLENAKILADAIANTFSDKKALIVASSDLSHYHSYKIAHEMDLQLANLFDNFKYQEISQKCESRQLEACGFGPIISMMMACEKMGFSKSKTVRYATSGDVPIGEKDQVVGYLGGVVYK
ncbi:MAG: MEMO1 family protein [Calditrichia bacterium]